GLVIDNSGRVVWYHRFPNGPGLNFQPQRNGHYAARPSPGTTGEVARWVEIDPLGTVIRTPGCAHGLSARFHDLLAEKDGSFWLMCDEKRTVEVSVAGGVMSVAVLGTSVQHLSQIGEVLFEWSPFDHLDLDYYSIPVVDRSASVINWTHGNAIDLDTDGNLLISFRNLSQVIKVDVSTGAVLWRLGGERNQFSLENSSLPPFTGQHGVRSVGAGQIQLLDNLGDAAGSRVQSYSVDEKRRTATVTGSRTASGGVVAFTGGSTQRLPGGHTLVAFGSGGAVEEFDSAGNIAWKINGSPGYIFRATRIRSLYHPGTDDPR
ncbi:MAG: arylsulfotransferase family protein, partial [Gemmatimonadaceae bacterium]